MRKSHETHRKPSGPINAVLTKVIDALSSKNATEAQAKSNDGEAKRPSRAYAKTVRRLADEKESSPPDHDPAHAPGHRRLTYASDARPKGRRREAKSELIHRTESPQRGQR